MLHDLIPLITSPPPLLAVLLPRPTADPSRAPESLAALECQLLLVVVDLVAVVGREEVTPLRGFIHPLSDDVLRPHELLSPFLLHDVPVGDLLSRPGGVHPGPMGLEAKGGEGRGDGEEVRWALLVNTPTCNRAAASTAATTFVVEVVLYARR